MLALSLDQIVDLLDQHGQRATYVRSRASSDIRRGRSSRGETVDGGIRGS